MQLKNLQILVVEDNPGDFVLIEEYLAEGMERPKIQHAQTFEKAKQLLKEKAVFNVILLDLALPDLSGKLLVQRMLEISGQIPVIVLTGYENQGFGLKTLSMGVADYLLKDEISPFILGKIIAYSIERSKINQAIKESEKKYRDIFNLSPQPMWVFNSDTFEFTDVNDAAIEHYGYSRDEFLAMSILDIRPKEEIPIVKKAIGQVKKDPNFILDHHKPFKHIKKNGEIIEVDKKTSKLAEGKNLVMVVAVDVTEMLAAQRAISKKSQLLAANAEIAGSLIKNEDWMNVLNQTFDSIGKAIDVDRVYYFENHIDPKTGKLQTSQKIEWAADQVEPQLDNPELQSLVQSEYSELYSVLSENEIFQSLTKDLPDSKFKKSLVSQDIISMLAFPIFVENYFYGFVGFDDCTRERKWTHEEIQYLQTIASNISNAINLRKTTNELEQSERRFKAMVQEGSDIIGILDKNFRFTYISPSMEDSYDRYLGEKAIDYVHPEDQKDVKESIEHLVSKKRIVLQPYRLRDINGNYHWVETIITNMLDEPAVGGYVANSRDITNRIEHEQKLRELSIVASKTTDLVVITDEKGRITWVNNAFEKLSGYSIEEAKGEKPGEFLQGPDTDLDSVQRITEAIENQESIDETILNYNKEGSKYWLEISIDPIFDEEGNCTHFIAIERDVTRKIKQDQELRESLERYDIVSKATSDTIWDLNIQTDAVQYNSNIRNMFGYHQSQVENIGIWWRDKIHPQDIETVEKTLADVLKDGRERFQLEYRFKAADGTYKYIFDRAFVLKNESGKPVRIIGAMQDVTQNVQIEQEIRSSLSEKETLLAEIHHRVKNNLAVVSGMMQLQAFDSDNEEIQNKLYDSVGRIKTMATVHELLYQSNSFSQIEFSETLTNLVENVSNTLQTGTDIELDIQCDPVTLNINQAIPASLIVNEVITNAYKHAFQINKKGKITFRLTKNNNAIHIQIGDNGVGIDEDNFSKGRSLGLHLIQVLCVQLNGSCKYKNQAQGAIFTLDFEKQVDQSGIGNATMI